MRRIALIVSLLLTVVAFPALGQRGDTSEVGDTDAESLKPGQFVWTPQLSPDGPMTVVVSLSDQRAYVFRNGIRIGASTISSGRRGYETPTGVFTILEKSVKHRSNRYSSAPMPYMQRLTWDGVALHAGKLPGYAASHGCVRLPFAFSKVLYAETSIGMTVVVTDGRPDLQTILDSGLADSLDPNPSSTPATDPTPTPTAAAAPESLPTPSSPDAHSTSNNPDPGLTSGVPDPTPITSDPDPPQEPAQREEFGWHPEIAPTGPVTILVSYAEQRILVLRDGKIIGRARADVPPHVFNGTAALQLEGFDAAGRAKWLYIGKPGRDANHDKGLDGSKVGQVHVPPEFLGEVRGILSPGVTMVVSDEPFAAGNAGQPTTVLAN
jgi:hypothetical protein